MFSYRLFSHDGCGNFSLIHEFLAPNDDAAATSRQSLARRPAGALAVDPQGEALGVASTNASRRTLMPMSATGQFASVREKLQLGYRKQMVLPVRIELTTSALPRMRSTTELRQHFVRKGAPMAATPAPVNPHSAQADPCRRKSQAACGKDDVQ